MPETGMKLHRVGKILMFFFFLLIIAGFSCFQAVWAAEIEGFFSLSGKEEQANRENNWTARLSFSEMEDLSAFRLTVTYDPDYLTLKKVQGSGAMEGNDFRYLLESSHMVGIYASAKHENRLEHAALEFTFQVNEEAPAGTTEIIAEMDQRVDASVQEVSGKVTSKTNLRITPVKTEHAFLTSLLPSEGKLEPSFSSEILEYQMTVPYEVHTITFEALPGENGTVRVNRKNLNQAGTPTVFLLTVTSENGKEKTQYVVTVTREEKSTTETGITTSVSSSTKGAGGTSSKTGSKTSSKKTSPETSLTGKIGGSSSKNLESELSPGAGEERQTAQPAVYGDRNLYMAGNQMSVFVIGILCACICGLVVVIVFLLWNQNRKGKTGGKQKKDEEKDSEKKE